MKLLAYIPYVKDMQSVYVIQKGKLVFDGFAYELEKHELRNAEMFNIYAKDFTLIFEVY